MTEFTTTYIYNGTWDDHTQSFVILNLDRPQTCFSTGTDNAVEGAFHPGEIIEIVDGVAHAQYPDLYVGHDGDSGWVGAFPDPTTNVNTYFFYSNRPDLLPGDSIPISTSDVWTVPVPTYDIYQVEFDGGSNITLSDLTPIDTNITITSQFPSAAPTGFTTSSSILPELVYDGNGAIPTGGSVIGDFAEINGVADATYFIVPHGAPVVAGSTTTDALNYADWVVCFGPGTLIATPDGERAVETLVAGDLVMTAGGSAKPVRWLGCTVRSSAFCNPHLLHPIRIKAGALGDNAPVRDLVVSPGHGILIEDALVNAGAMVNGVSVVRDNALRNVIIYYHVELDDHELLISDGAVSESFLMGAEETVFNNIADRPSTVSERAEMAYPRVKSARQLPLSVRSLLAERAAIISPDTRIAA